MHKSMLTRWLLCLLALLMAGATVACAPFSVQNKQSVTWLDAFDTVSTVTAYGVDPATFAAQAEELHTELLRYHKLYDIYHTYEGITNLRSVNDAAGGEPLAVDSAITDLLTCGLDAYALTDGRVNVVFGAVLTQWHNCRTAALDDPETAHLPDPVALRAATAHVSPDSLEIDSAAGTVRLTDREASLDVGAVAKGFVAERLASYATAHFGWTSALLDIGGNVRAIGDKNGSPFVIGIQNPDTDSADAYLTTVNVRDAAVVTSGDYQRYFTVNGQRYAHIIDVDTLMPATVVRAVTVICPADQAAANAGLADILSTALFTLSPADGKRLLDRVGGVEAVWVLSDGTVCYSDGFDAYLHAR